MSLWLSRFFRLGLSFQRAAGTIEEMSGQVYRVEKLVAGGDGIVRDRSQTIFVPFVIPGEQVRIEVLAGSRQPVRAKVTELVSASPDRVEPHCPLFMTCGGCQLQHIAYERQLRLKGEILAEVLARIGKIEAELKPMLASPLPYHYRSRIKLQVRAGRAGFFGVDHRSLVPVTYCCLAYEGINLAIPQAAELIAAERPKTVELIEDADGALVAVAASGRKEKIFCRRETGWGHDPARQVAFRQVNPAQNEVLRSIVAEAVGRIQPEGVIELYAGAGNLTGELMRHCTWLVAVDSDRAAVALAQERFSFASPAPVNFLLEKAEDFLASEWAGRMRPELVVLDPPRTGAKPAIPGVVQLRPEHVLYVSCDPASLARDLRELADGGYHLEQVIALDMFPQTSHIESVALLSKLEGG